MTAAELLSFRRRMGWSRQALGEALGISPSRIRDFEVGHSRGRNPQPAPIPKVVDLACRYLGGERAPKTDAEWLALWDDTANLPADRPQLPGAAGRRESFYEDCG
jgi:hypothetical protein